MGQGDDEVPQRIGGTGREGVGVDGIKGRAGITVIDVAGIAIGAGVGVDGVVIAEPGNITRRP